MEKEKIYLWEDEGYDCLSSPKLVPGTPEYKKFQFEEADNSNNKEDGTSSYISNAYDSFSSVMCSICTLSFKNRLSLVHHYQTELHVMNQDRVLNGNKPMELAKYNSMKGNKNSSVSSSKKSSPNSRNETNSPHDHLQLIRSPRLFFSNKDNQVVSIYRTLVAPKKHEFESSTSLLASVSSLCSNRQHWMILMESGGHFAGAVFEDSKVVVHKSFHSYTVRKGQGGLQSSADNRSSTSQSRSAGSSLRRYNMITHFEHIKDILENWREHFKKCSHVFVRSGHNTLNPLLFSSNKQSPSLMQPKSEKLRRIPFSTRKPTFKEVRRVHKQLSEVKLHGELDSFVPDTGSDEQSDEFSDVEVESVDERDSGDERESGDDVESSDDIDSSDDLESSDGDVSATDSTEDDENDNDDDNLIGEMICEELQSYIKSNDLKRLDSFYSMCKFGSTTHSNIFPEKLVEHFKSNRLNVYNHRINSCEQSLLHLATVHSKKELVQFILKSGKANISLNDYNGKVPYSLATKKIKAIYKNFREENPSLYNYRNSCIPGEDTKPSASTTSKKSKKMLKKEKAAIKSEEVAVEEIETASNEPKCKECRGTVSMPYCYKGFKFCAMSCMKQFKLTDAKPKDHSESKSFTVDESKSSGVKEVASVRDKLSDYRQKKMEALAKEKAWRVLPQEEKDRLTELERRRVEREKRAEAAERRMKLMMTDATSAND